MRVTPQCDTVNSFSICSRADAQFGPAIAYNGENYIVVWSDRRFTGTYWWLTAARITPDGTVLDTGYIVGGQGSTNEFYADLACDGDRCLAVWYHSYYAPWGIYGRFINRLARAEDSVIGIAATRTRLYNFPKVEFGDSAYLVVWADHREGAEDYDIRSRLVAPDGRLLGSEQLLATGPAAQERPDAGFDGHEFLAVWSEDGVVKGRRVGSDGVPVDTAFVLSDTNANRRACPRIATGSSNRLVVWSEQRGAETDIYGTLPGRPGLSEAGADPAAREPGTTFSVRLRAGEQWFDRSGRAVDASRTAPGVYFSVTRDRQVRKTVIAR